jgi:hypothetical protein
VVRAATSDLVALGSTWSSRRRAGDETAPLRLDGDLNLGPGDGPDLQSCLPAGSALVDDGGRQHLVATPECRADSSRTIERGRTALVEERDCVRW